MHRPIASACSILACALLVASCAPSNPSAARVGTERTDGVTASPESIAPLPTASPAHAPASASLPPTLIPEIALASTPPKRTPAPGETATPFPTASFLIYPSLDTSVRLAHLSVTLPGDVVPVITNDLRTYDGVDIVVDIYACQGVDGVEYEITYCRPGPNSLYEDHDILQQTVGEVLGAGAVVSGHGYDTSIPTSDGASHTVYAHEGIEDGGRRVRTRSCWKDDVLVIVKAFADDDAEFASSSTWFGSMRYHP